MFNNITEEQTRGKEIPWFVFGNYWLPQAGGTNRSALLKVLHGKRFWRYVSTSENTSI